MAVIRDGDWRLYDYDYQTGRSQWIMHNPDGSFTMRTDYPVDKLIEQNRMELNESNGKRWGDGRRVASIPLNIYHEQLAEASHQQDDQYLSKWLNDSDHRAFRTFEGKV